MLTVVAVRTLSAKDRPVARRISMTAGVAGVLASVTALTSLYVGIPGVSSAVTNALTFIALQIVYLLRFGYWRFSQQS